MTHGKDKGNYQDGPEPTRRRVMVSTGRVSQGLDVHPSQSPLLLHGWTSSRAKSVSAREGSDSSRITRPVDTGIACPKETRINHTETGSPGSADHGYQLAEVSERHRRKPTSALVYVLRSRLEGTHRRNTASKGGPGPDAHRHRARRESRPGQLEELLGRRTTTVFALLKFC